LGGSKVENFDLSLIMKKRATLVASTLRNRSDKYKATLINAFKEDCLQDFVTG
jgi:hypothetical protein